MKKKFDKVYQFKVVLKHTEPPIWRRIQVPKTYTFWDLHVAVQDVMGWEDYHLHEFLLSSTETGGNLKIGIPEGDFDKDVHPGWKCKITDYLSEKNRSADYVYDFGDYWEHTIELEKILPREENIKYPVCIEGEMACPPEDCGGIYGYYDLLDIIGDPNHKEHEDMLDWLGEGYDPEHFDANQVKFDDPSRRQPIAF